MIVVQLPIEVDSKTSISVTALGPLEVRRGSRLISLRGTRAGLCLVYLRHYSSRLVPRSELTELLWGVDSRAARHSLSQVIYGLRQALSEVSIHGTPEAIGIDPTVVQYDVDDLHRAVRMQHYSVAADLYRGRFLESIAAPPTAAFEHWIDRVGRETSTAAAVVFRHHLYQAEATASWTEAEKWSTKLLELDEFDEVAHANRIRATAALLGIEAASRLALDVRAQFGSAVGGIKGIDLRQTCDRYADLSVAVPVRSAELPIRGRIEEFRAMSDTWTRANAGPPQIILVSGGAGIGKTRLTDHYLRWSAIQGSRILTAKATHSDVHVPFATLTQLLRSGIRASDVEKLPTPWRTWLGTILPEHGSNAAAGQTNAQPGQRELFETVARLLEPMCERAPLVIFVDDVDLCDQASAWLIHFLFQRMSGEKLVVVFATRASMLELHEHTGILLRSMAGTRLQSVPLAPLTDAAAVEIIHDVLGDRIADLSSEISDIVRQAGGIPYYIIEAAASGKGQSSVSTEFGVGHYSVLAGIRALPPLPREVLQALAVLGYRAPRSIVRATATCTSDEFSEALAYLRTNRLVRVSGAFIEFQHDLVREAVLTDLPEDQGRSLNRRAAVATSSLTSTPPGKLAVHYTAADMPTQAYRAAIEAAESASRLHLQNDAEFYLRLAISKAPGDRERLIARAKLVDHFCTTENYNEAVNLTATVPGIIDYLELPTVILLDMYRQLSDASKTGSDVMANLESASELVSSTSDDDARLRLLRTVISIGTWIGSPMVGTILKHTAANAPSFKISPETAKLYACLAKTWTLYEGGEEALSFADRAVAVARQTGDVDCALMTLIGRATVRLLLGDLIRAEVDFLECDRLAAEDATLANTERLIVNRSLFLIETCRAAAAEQQLERLLGIQLPLDSLPIRGNLAIAALEMRKEDLLLRRIRELRNVNASLQVQWVSLFADCMEAYCLRMQGCSEAAQALVQHLASEERRGGDRFGPDPSYTQALIAEHYAEASAEQALSYIDRAVKLYSRRNVLGETRVRLVRAAILLRYNPDAGKRELRELMDRCKVGGALTLLASCEQLARAACL